MNKNEISKICEIQKYKEKLFYDPIFKYSIDCLLNAVKIDEMLVVSLISNLCDIIESKNKLLCDLYFKQIESEIKRGEF